MAAPDAVLELVERFARNRVQYLNPAYNETQVRREFLDPFFAALGWDVDNAAGHAQQYKDVVHEDAIKVGLDSRAPDYSFRIGGQRKFFVEAKKPAVNLKDDPAPAYQLRRYAWSAKLPLSLLTDFQELAVYDCRVKTAAGDKPSAARTLYYPDRPYEFSVLPADILGQVYEQFLGKVIRLTAGHRAVVEDKPEVKKAGGVYYTPTYIVDNIVKHTVGRLLGGSRPSRRPPCASSTRSAASGSFLIGAYQYLLDWHRDWYAADAQGSAKKHAKALYQGRGGEWRLTTIEERGRPLAEIAITGVKTGMNRIFAFHVIEDRGQTLMLMGEGSEEAVELERQFVRPDCKAESMKRYAFAPDVSALCSTPIDSMATRRRWFQRRSFARRARSPTNTLFATSLLSSDERAASLPGSRGMD